MYLLNRKTCKKVNYRRRGNLKTFLTSSGDMQMSQLIVLRKTHEHIFTFYLDFHLNSY